MQGIALVTDSTRDLPESEKRKYVTAVVALHVWAAGQSYRGRVGFGPSEFFKRVRETGQAAQSSQPSVGEFIKIYQELLKEHSAVVSVQISGRLSGTVQTASIAAESVDASRIRVIDRIV